MIYGDGLHEIAIIIRECASVANRTPHTHVERVVGCRLVRVVQPEHKIVLTHIRPEHEVLFVTQLSMHSSMCLRNVGVGLGWRYGRTSWRWIRWR